MHQPPIFVLLKKYIHKSNLPLGQSVLNIYHTLPFMAKRAETAGAAKLFKLCCSQDYCAHSSKEKLQLYPQNYVAGYTKAKLNIMGGFMINSLKA